MAKATIPPPLAPKAHVKLRRKGGAWQRGAGGAVLVGAVLWWLWPASPQSPSPATVEVPVAQARQAGQAWPFGPGAAAAEPAAEPNASLWARLDSAPEPDEPDEISGPDPRLQNASIDPARLSVHQTKAAQAFLNHVVLQPEPRGGFLVEAVLPGSLYERAGLRPGDGIYTLDVPGQAAVDENNMVALTSLHEMTFDVVRAGALVRLSVQLNQEAAADGDT